MKGISWSLRRLFVDGETEAAEQVRGPVPKTPQPTIILVFARVLQRTKGHRLSRTAAAAEDYENLRKPLS